MKRTESRIGAVRCIAGLTAMFLCVALHAAPAATAVEVGYYDFGIAADGEIPAQFADSIDARDEMDACMTDIPLNRWDWRTIPKKRTPSSWVSLVRVKTGQVCDFMVFQFSDRVGTVAYAAHRSSRIRSVLYWFKVPPGPDQLPGNAIRECATDFIFAQRDSAQGRTAVRLVLESWPADGDTVEPGPGMDSLPESDVRVPRALQKPVEALAYCAAYEAGWQPTAGAASATLTVAIREDASPLHYSLKCEYRHGGKTTRSVTRRNVPRSRIYANLARVFFVLRRHETHLGFGDLGSYKARVRGWTNGVALVTDGRILKVLNPASGTSPWSIEAVSLKGRFLVDGLPNAPRAVCGFDNGLTIVCTQSGSATRLASVVPTDDGSFAVLTTNTVAIVGKDGLALYRDGAREYLFEGSGFAGPLFVRGPLLIAPRSDGRLTAIVSADRKQAWTTELSGVAELFASDGRVLLAATAEDVCALDPATGTILWRHAVGERLVSEPRVLGSHVVIATKSNEICILDVASGAVVARRKWPTWIKAMDVSPAGESPAVACLDLRNVVSLLSAEDLATVQQVAFPLEMEPTLVAAVDVPREWRNEAPPAKDSLMTDLMGEAGEKGPAWLLSDRDGFVFVVPFGKDVRQ